MISGMVTNSRPNIGFNSRHDGNRMRGKHRSNDNVRRSDKMFDDLVKSGLFGKIQFGSKYCFNVGRLTKEEKSEFNCFIKYYSEDDENAKKKALSQNWWTVELDAFTEENFAKMEVACEFYQNIENAKERCRFNVYGTIKLPVDLSNIKLVKSADDDGLVKYPYGAIFFGDSKNSRDMMDAHVACIGSCAAQLKEERNEYFVPIEDPKFDINGIIKTNGRLIVYYVDGEETTVATDSGVEETYPVLNYVEVLFSAVRNRTDTYRKGFVEKIYISRVENTNDPDKDREPLVVEDVADYVLSVAFAKNETDLNKDVILHNAADYIWMIGENYEDYDISEQGFVQRRTDLGLEATQKFIGEEYHKKDDHKDSKNPKKFVKTEPTFKVSVDDGDDEETEEEIVVENT